MSTVLCFRSPLFCRVINAVMLLTVLLLYAALVGCGGNGDDRPFQSAGEVKAAYNAAPQILSDQREAVGMYVEAFGSTYVQFRYGDQVYNQVLSGGYDGFSYWEGTLKNGVSIKLLTEYRDYEGAVQLMFLGGKRVQLELHAERDGVTRKVLINDIREHGEWLIIHGTIYLRAGDSFPPVNYWAVYNLTTGEFIDYGPDGS